MEDMFKIIEEYFFAQCKKHNVKQNKIEKLHAQLINQFNNKQVDFASKIKFKRVHSLGKKRSVVYIQNKFCLEYFLMQYFYKNIKELNVFSKNKIVNVNYKNIKCLNEICKYENLTIIRFDFKNYYNNLSSEYIYEKFIKHFNISELEKYYLKEYTTSIPYCFAGLCTSNDFAELININFEEQLNIAFNKIAPAICFHYGDDCNIFINKKISKDQAIEIINSTIQKVYHDKNIIVKNPNKEKIHTSGSKFSYITDENLPITFNFLGYEYYLYKQDGKFNYTYGLIDYTMNKFISNLKNSLILYKDNIEAQRHIVSLRTCVISFPVTKDNTQVKYVSPFIVLAIKCLKIQPNKINDKTLNFLKTAVFEAYNQANIPLPYFLKDKSINSKYNLYYSILKRKSVLLSEHNGIPKPKLIKMLKCFCKEDLSNLSYNALAEKIVDKCKLVY